MTTLASIGVVILALLGARRDSRPAEQSVEQHQHWAAPNLLNVREEHSEIYCQAFKLLGFEESDVVIPSSLLDIGIRVLDDRKFAKGSRELLRRSA